MEILIPYYNIDEIDFYYHLIGSLNKILGGRVHITYVVGEVRDELSREYRLHELNFLSSMKGKTLKSYLYKNRIYEQLKNVSIDVIFVISDLWALELSCYCSTKLGIPYVVWMRGDHREVRKIRKINWLKRIIANYFEMRYLNKASLVIPNCMSLYEKLYRWGIERDKITKPVHNGVDCEVFKPLNIPRSDKFTIGFAGRICLEKRVDELLRIAKKLKNEDIRLTVAGPKVMDITFPENVQYLGRLPFLEMPKFYNAIDLLVLPSATEGFPSVILEAYACEKPVLASKEAFPKELKIFGAVTDLKEFESEILRLKREDNLREIGKEARDYVKENFNWKNFASQIMVYLESAKNSSRRE
ncbi:MAG: glycosyltransferase family 4 protein [Candidatus Bathyarchaeia archaeon]